MGHTQTAIADLISKELDLPIRLGRHFIKRVLEIAADDIVYTGRIALRGLGSFTVTTRPPVSTTHPETGHPIVIPAKKILRFHTSLAIRRRLNPPRPARKGKQILYKRKKKTRKS